MNDIIKREHVLNHSIDKVWDAISKGEEISAWFIQADFKPQTGYKYTFTASEDQGCVEITGEVKNAAPYTLIYTWIVQNTQVETTVKWELEKFGNNTKLVLEHSGISNYEGETAIAMFKDFSNGWGACVDELEKFLNKSVHAV